MDDWPHWFGLAGLQVRIDCYFSILSILQIPFVRIRHNKIIDFINIYFFSSLLCKYSCKTEKKSKKKYMIN